MGEGHKRWARCHLQRPTARRAAAMDFHGRGSGGAGGAGPDPALIMDQARACAASQGFASCVSGAGAASPALARDDGAVRAEQRCATRAQVKNEMANAYLQARALRAAARVSPRARSVVADAPAAAPPRAQEFFTARRARVRCHRGGIARRRAALTHRICVAAAQTVRDRCFDKCITRPGTSMSSGEVTCLAKCCDRYIDVRGAAELAARSLVARPSRLSARAVARTQLAGHQGGVRHGGADVQAGGGGRRDGRRAAMTRRAAP
jgi:hypothetical protein